MNLADLVATVAESGGIGKAEAKRQIEAVLQAIVAAASKGEEVSLPGFGKFKVTTRAAREGRNPRTGETMTFAASKKLAFTAAKPVRDALNR